MHEVAGTTVVVVLWPEGANELAQLRADGTPRLVMVPPGEHPPCDPDPSTDWIRMPVDDEELRVRLQVLEQRASTGVSDAPELRGDGRLFFRGKWVTISPLPERLMATLIARYGDVVAAEDLMHAAWPADEAPQDRLRVQIVRLRGMLAPLGLCIRTVRDRGYSLGATGDRVNSHTRNTAVTVQET